MLKIITIVLISAFSFKSVADVARNLRGQPKQNKLVVHSCDTRNFDARSCRVVSDINLNDVINSLNSDSPSIYSEETVEVKKGVSPEGFVMEEPYWKTCDAEDGDCIEWNVGAFRNYISNQYSVTIEQRDVILNKILENSLQKNTHVYFFSRNTIVGKSVDDGLATFFDLTKTKMLVK